MSRFLLPLILLILNSNIIWSQIEASDICFDNNGSMIITGEFDRIIEFNNSIYSKPKGATDIFIAKYNNKGVFEWQTSIGGSGTENSVGVFADNNGGIFIAGNFNGECKFGPLKIKQVANKLYPSSNFFLAKYNVSGDPIWIKNSKNQGMDAATSIVGDNAGNIYVAGVFNNQLTLDGQTIKSTGKNDIFVLKIASNGILSWLKAFGTTDDENTVKINYNNGKLLVCGSILKQDRCLGFLLNVNSQTGSANWTKEFGNKHCEIEHAITDQQGNIYFTGFIENKINNIDKNLYMGKLSGNGDIVWEKKCTGNNPIGTFIANDGSGNICVGGNFIDTLRIDNKLLVGFPKEDIFFTQLTGNGKVISASFIGNSKYEKCHKLITRKDKVFIFGTFSDGLTFGNYSLKGGDNSVFGVYAEPSKANFSDPILFLKESQNYEADVKIIDINGKLLYGKENNKSYLSDQPLYIEDNNGNIIRRTVTDEHGDFSFKSMDASTEMNLVLENNDKLKTLDAVYLAQQNGIIIEKISPEKSFKYKLIPAVLTRLEPMEFDDNLSMKIKEFKSSTVNEISVMQQISYEPGSFLIPAESMAQLNEIVTYLRQNQKVILEINAHTDANGDDNSNLMLSQKRADEVKKYFVKKRIQENRINAKGYGESKIQNRCQNDVKCTDLEHSYNRRTEFKFIKGPGL